MPRLEGARRHLLEGRCHSGLSAAAACWTNAGCNFEEDPMFRTICKSVLFPPYGVYKVFKKAEQIADSLQKPFYFPDQGPQNEPPDEGNRKDD
jgi:hypothetical protein